MSLHITAPPRAQTKLHVLLPELALYSSPGTLDETQPLAL